MKEGKLSESRIDESMRRLLRQKFELGLFDQPFVDDKNVPLVIGRPEAKALVEKTQKISMTLLKNDKATLPLKKQKHKVYIENIDSATVAQYASVGNGEGFLNIMIGNQNSDISQFKFCHYTLYLFNCDGVNAGKWFVQKDEFGIGSKCS